MRTLIAVLCCSVLSSTIWASEAAQKLSDLTVRLCGTTAYPPASWVTPNGRVEGVNAMVARQLLTSLGVTVDDQQNSNWQRCLKEVELGNVDVMAGYRNEQRMTFVQYLDTPIMLESINLFFPASKPLKFTDWDDLSDLRVGVLMGDSFGDEVDAALSQYPLLERVSSQHQNLLKLADGRLDAVPMGRISGQIQIDALGLTGQIGSTQTDVNDYWYLAISKKSPLIEWYSELNQALAHLLADPQLIPVWTAQQNTMYLNSLSSHNQMELTP